jgi:flagellar biosynthesis/type III secretory pathway protein FliH
VSVEQAVQEAVEAVQLEAQAREEMLLRQAAQEREKAVNEAYARGLEEGRTEGEIAEGARLRSAVMAAEGALAELRAGEVRWTGAIDENICALAVVIARHVIQRELAIDIGPVAELVRAALAEFPIDQPIRIRINPSDLNALTSVRATDQDPLQAIAGNREARWFPDATIAPGGCVVEGRERIIDGRVDTALERVYRRITYTNA